MNNLSNRIASAIKMFGLFAIVAAFAMAAFPGASFASASDPVTYNTDAIGKLAISVFDGQKGSAVSGAVIYVYSATSPSTQPIAKAQTNAEGQAVVELPEGNYHLKIAAQGYKNSDILAQVVRDRTTTTGVKLQPASSLSLAIT